MLSSILVAVLALNAFELTHAYNLIHNYNYTNWYTSFTFENASDPTKGTVEYISLEEAESLGMTRIIGSQVYMSVDNNTVISDTSQGRKSIWIESKDSFLHGILIGDFEHIPGSDCGTWPAFWTIRNGEGTYGEIDIIEGFNDIKQNYMTLHTGGECTFNSPTNMQTGQSNNNNYDCSLSSDVGCSVMGPEGSYGTNFNEIGGGVYAMWWTSDFIKIYFFPRGKIPADITSENPNPASWGLPAGNFDSSYGNCDLDANFPPQTIYFDIDFCGAEAGGQAWTTWTDCSTKTGYSTCADYVRGVPSGFDDAYWLINSVKVYQ